MDRRSSMERVFITIRGTAASIIPGPGHGDSTYVITHGPVGRLDGVTVLAGSTTVSGSMADGGAVGPEADGGVRTSIVPLLHGADTGAMASTEPTTIVTGPFTRPISIRIFMPDEVVCSREITIRSIIVLPSEDPV